jgi:hypothetical protein
MTLKTKEGVGGQKWFLAGTFGNRDDARDKGEEFKDDDFVTSISKASNGEDWDLWIRPKGKATERQTEILTGLVGIAVLGAVGLAIAGNI